MKKRVIKNHTLGEGVSNYTCLYDWPKDCAIQCGGKGIVMGNEVRSGYVTSFFEAFPFDMFLRGEGSDVEEAEKSAWEQYKKILECEQHNLKPIEKTPRDALCVDCGLKIRNYYPPVHFCSVCSTPHTQLNINDEHLCLEHYIVKAETTNFDITPDKISVFKEDIFKEIKNKNEKDFFDMIFSKENNINKPEDIPDDYYKLEMKIDALNRQKELLNICRIIDRTCLQNHFQHEYQMLDWMIKKRELLSNSAIKKTADIFHNIFNQMKDNNTIKPDFDRSLFFEKNENCFDEIEKQLRTFLFIYYIHKDFNIGENELYYSSFGHSKEFMWQEIHNKALIAIYTYI